MDILLVDDETAFAGLLADRLRLRGYTVRCAPNAETALRLIGEKAPDVAFLDVGLPGMDGIGLLEKIRLMPAPVICCMLTGAAQVSVAARALRSGAFDWLAKPVTLEAVEKVLSRAREHQKKARQQEILAEAARMRTLERLTQGIAHEVNNPVNIMQQWIKIHSSLCFSIICYFYCEIFLSDSLDSPEKSACSLHFCGYICGYQNLGCPKREIV